MKIILIALQTIDGYIAQGQVDSLDWGTKEDKRYFNEMVKKVEYKIMGSTTFESMKNFPKLLGEYSRTIVMTSNPDRYGDYSNQYSPVEFINKKAEEIIDELKARKVESVAIVGGSSVYTQFLNSRLVDDIYLTVAPKIFGTGIKLVNEYINLDVELVDIQKLGDDEILLHYKINK